MEDELEIVGAASVGAAARDINGDGFLQGPCPNCETELRGEFCWACGQSAKDMKRPIWTLFIDVLNAFFAFDGRIAKTLPSLIFRPGHVTRAYIKGKRVRYVPPFRLFLIASVIFFLTLFSIGQQQSWMEGDDLTVNANRSAISNIIVDGQPLGEIEGFDAIFDEEGKIDPAAANVFLTQLENEGRIESGQDFSNITSILERADGVTLSRSDLFASIQKWAPRLSFLLVPFTVISLTLLHFWIRRIYIYDHVVVALHLQTFIYFAATLAMAFSFISPGWAWTIFGLSIPIYLLILLGKSYDTHWFFNINRIIALLVSTLIALFLLVIAVSFISASEAGAFGWDDLLSEDEFMDKVLSEPLDTQKPPEEKTT